MGASSHSHTDLCLCDIAFKMMRLSHWLHHGYDNTL